MLVEKVHIYFHSVVAGSESLGHCITGINNIISQFKNKNIKFLIWFNHGLGAIEMDGISFFEMDGISFFEPDSYKAIEKDIYAILELHKYNPDTFGKDLEYMLSNNLIFEEVINSKSLTIASKHRYTRVQNEIYSMLEQVITFKDKQNNEKKL